LQREDLKKLDEKE